MDEWNTVEASPMRGMRIDNSSAVSHTSPRYASFPSSSPPLQSTSPGGVSAGMASPLGEALCSSPESIARGPGVPSLSALYDDDSSDDDDDDDRNDVFTDDEALDCSSPVL